MTKEDEVEEVYEEVDALEESDDEFVYEEVDIDEDDEDLLAEDAEDLDAAMRSLQGLSDAAAASAEKTKEAAPGEVTKRPEVVDDFVRNFLVRMGLTSTLEKFETEWYELAASGKLKREDLGAVPDVYLYNQELNDSVTMLRHELDAARAIATKATSTWDKFRKERDFHRMHHKRVAQEKNKLVTDLKRLRKHYSQYEPTIKELQHKYEIAMKEKMLTRLERDRLLAKVESLELTAASKGEEAAAEVSAAPSKGSTTAKGTVIKKRAGDAPMPSIPSVNPYATLKFDPMEIKNFKLQKTFKGHLMSVSNCALHPKKSILATASDDATWKMWDLPNGDLIMSGDGHKDWVAGVNFHPKGTHLASASGDCTVKIWDFEKKKCTVTFTEHTQAVWNAAFHHSGDFLASCSLDHSARLWDLHSNRCRATFRGHVDSVNEVCWQPFTNNVATGSSDKTVSLWDMRTGLCAQTFYGHLNSCNHVAFNLRGDTVVSCDADGLVKLWDVRMVAELLSVDCGPHPANKCAFDRSSESLAVASDDGSIKCFSALDGSKLCELTGHEDAVQGVVFDPFGKFLISCGSDSTFRYWA